MKKITDAVCGKSNKKIPLRPGYRWNNGGWIENEKIDLDELDTIDFYKVKYRLHVLGVLYPDKNKSARENCKEMCRMDYELKKNAYERIYAKPLSYEFKSCDIAGWIDYKQVFEDEG